MNQSDKPDDKHAPPWTLPKRTPAATKTRRPKAKAIPKAKAAAKAPAKKTPRKTGTAPKAKAAKKAPAAAKATPPKTGAAPNAKAKPKAAAKAGPAAGKRPEKVEVPVEDLANGLINVLGDGLGFTIDTGRLALSGGITGAKLAAGKTSSGINAGLGIIGSLVSQRGWKTRKGGKTKTATAAKTPPPKAEAAREAKTAEKTPHDR